MSVVRMVVLIERASPDSSLAVSRGWVIPESLFADLDDTLHRVFGAPVEEGMRDLESGRDLYMHPENAGPATPTGTMAGPATGEDDQSAPRGHQDRASNEDTIPHQEG